MFGLLIKYINHSGDEVFRWLPVFQTMDECEWWRDWFLDMLTTDHASAIKAVCEAV